MNEASSRARTATQAAISSAVPSRPTGMPATIFSSTFGGTAWIGMTADVGAFPRLCGLIRQGWVRELAYTGRRLPAAKAKEIGLVNAVFDTQDQVLATAREIASKARLAVAGSKVMINYARDHTTDDGLDYIATWQTGMFAGAHMAEAFAARQEKRDADFPDLLPLRKGL